MEEELNRKRFDPSVALLGWYDLNARTLPWRAGPEERRRGVVPDPYLVWLSEIMLQQTGVKTVIPYFETFRRRWRSVDALAAALDDDVMAAWAGLGYYSRARNLIACARTLCEHHDGRFPETAAELIRLPGIGAYTSAAIAAIAFGERVAVIDGNVERVIARFFAVSTPMPAAKSEIREHLDPMVPADRPGEFAEAMMDLGATTCQRTPVCGSCPLNSACQASSTADPRAFPAKAPRRKRPRRYGNAYVALRADGKVLLRRRAKDGLLGGMMEVPGSAWLEKRSDEGAAPFQASWRPLAETVTHGFTHFELELTVHQAEVGVSQIAPSDCRWHALSELDKLALPRVMTKVIEAAARRLRPSPESG